MTNTPLDTIIEAVAEHGCDRTAAHAAKVARAVVAALKADQWVIVSVPPDVDADEIEFSWHYKQVADHPHSDPGDGRTECDVCGKWVYPAIHSCKGVPVTLTAFDRLIDRTNKGDNR